VNKRAYLRPSSVQKNDPFAPYTQGSYPLSSNRSVVLSRGESGRKECPVASPEPSAEITLSRINFVAAETVNTGGNLRFNYHVLAYLAAAALAEHGIYSLVVTEDNFIDAPDIVALDDAEFPIPVGRFRFIVVGQPAFDLLPERTQQFVFFPPRPEESDYFGAVGTEVVGREPARSALEDTENKLAEILNVIARENRVFPGNENLGDAYKARVRAFRQIGEDAMQTG